ncbi:MAG: hypothetical protein JNM56_02110 [Planctomycetia bacterium]|nr:hypothetical protein [Planctomycetia bacterium]
MTMKKQGRDPATLAMRRLVKRLEKAKIVHAVMGGMAVYAHGYRRFTDDVDVLVTPQGLETFRSRFVPNDYELVAGKKRRFVDRMNGVTVDLVIAGHFPGFRSDGPITFPDPSAVRQQIDSIYFIDLTTLIQLKLAALRPQDYADVVDLIRANQLDESFLTRLHPSLHHDFLEGLAHVRREAEYEARED